MKYKIGDLVADDDGNTGVVVIKWDDGDICDIENDTAHPTGIGEYDVGTGGIKLHDGENSRACSCFGHKAGESMVGWSCPVHGHCF